MRLMSRVAAVAVAALVAAPSLHAQASFSVAAGAALPIGSTADAVKTGYNVTAAVGIKPPIAPIGLRFDGMLNGFDSKASGGPSVRVMGVSANLTLSSATMIPMGYLIGGVGMYNSKAEGFDAENDFGFNIGAGIKFPLTGFSTFLEARLHIVNSEGESTKFVPLTFGITF